MVRNLPSPKAKNHLKYLQHTRNLSLPPGPGRDKSYDFTKLYRSDKGTFLLFLGVLKRIDPDKNLSWSWCESSLNTETCFSLHASNDNWLHPSHACSRSKQLRQVHFSCSHLFLDLRFCFGCLCSRLGSSVISSSSTSDLYWNDPRGSLKNQWESDLNPKS